MYPKLLHNIGTFQDSNYNTREEIMALPKDAVLTFDGIYRNVYENMDILEGRNIIFFVMGDYVGKDNHYQDLNKNKPFERMCDWHEIGYLVGKLHAKLGWHTWSHPNLTKVDDETLKREVTPPFPMDLFGYPYGDFDERVIQAVKDAGFTEGWSVIKGDNSQFQKLRQYV